VRTAEACLPPEPAEFHSEMGQRELRGAGMTQSRQGGGRYERVAQAPNPQSRGCAPQPERAKPAVPTGTPDVNFDFIINRREADPRQRFEDRYVRDIDQRPVNARHPAWRDWSHLSAARERCNDPAMGASCRVSSLPNEGRDYSVQRRGHSATLEVHNGERTCRELHDLVTVTNKPL